MSQPVVFVDAVLPDKFSSQNIVTNTLINTMSADKREQFDDAVVSSKAEQHSARVGAQNDRPMTLYFNAMGSDDLLEVDAIERDIYHHPWRLGNFQDSLNSGYQCWVARNRDGQLIGYFLVMMTPDEAHLLNITVASAFQQCGVGHQLLNQIFAIVRNFGLSAILLEVRPSNLRALAIYRHIGFKQIGLRKSYYPAANQQREDAIVMRLTFTEAQL
jgi:ribosomal-protein-alanine N-acetyltransferase